MIYCIDTSAILEGWVRYYPPDVFPSLWEGIESMIRSEELISCEEVLHELSQKEDNVYQWAMNNSDMFVPLDEEIQLATQEILEDFQKLVKERNNRNQADPFVIALAKLKKAIVVSGERGPGSPNKPNIPFVCSELNIQHIDLLTMIREKGWKFR